MHKSCIAFGAKWFDWLHSHKTHKHAHTTVLPSPKIDVQHINPLPYTTPTLCSNGSQSNYHKFKFSLCKHTHIWEHKEGGRGGERTPSHTVQDITQCLTRNTVSLSPLPSYSSTDPNSASCATLSSSKRYTVTTASSYEAKHKKRGKTRIFSQSRDNINQKHSFCFCFQLIFFFYRFFLTV